MKYPKELTINLDKADKDLSSFGEMSKKIPTLKKFLDVCFDSIQVTQNDNDPRAGVNYQIINITEYSECLSIKLERV